MPAPRKRKCRACKQWFQPAGRGRRPEYCSAACRQEAYRRRTRRKPPALRALESDLFAIRDREERKRGAVKALNDLGYEVHLGPLRRPQVPERRPRLRVVRNEQDEESDPPVR